MSMRKIRVGVIPAAGRGERIAELPLTKLLPKPMLPIANKPILEYVIENMKRSGINQIYVVIGHKSEIIKEYFGNGSEFGVDISYIYNKNIEKGLAHSIGLSEELVDEPFLTILGDDLTISKSLSNLVSMFLMKRAIVVEGVVAERDKAALTRTCCVVLEKTGKIKKIIEKPIKPISNLRGIGVYLFDPLVFEFIKRTPLSSARNEKEITDTIGLLAKEEKAYGCLINGTNVNINTLSDLIRATRLLLE